MDFLLWIGIVFLLGLLAFIAHEDLALLTVRRVRTRGTVYDHRRSVDDGSEYFFAMVRFKADDGRWVEFTDTYGGGTPLPAVGTAVDIVYPAGTPDKARVRRLWVRWLIYAFVLGVLAVLIGRLIGILK